MKGMDSHHRVLQQGFAFYFLIGLCSCGGESPAECLEIKLEQSSSGTSLSKHDISSKQDTTGWAIIKNKCYSDVNNVFAMIMADLSSLQVPSKKANASYVNTIQGTIKVNGLKKEQIVVFPSSFSLGLNIPKGITPLTSITLHSIGYIGINIVESPKISYPIELCNGC